MERDLSGFITPEHVEAQRQCVHQFHCAVDGRTRANVLAMLDRAREHSPVEIPLFIAQLTGPCCLPPASIEGGHQ